GVRRRDGPLARPRARAAARAARRGAARSERIRGGPAPGRRSLEGRARLEQVAGRRRPPFPGERGARVHSEGAALGGGDSRPGPLVVTAPRVGVAAVAVAIAVFAYRVQVDNLHSPWQRSAATVAIGLAFVVTGLIAWARRPGNRLGPIMIAAGYALLLRQ